MKAYKTNEPKWDFTVTESPRGEWLRADFTKRPKGRKLSISRTSLRLQLD